MCAKKRTAALLQSLGWLLLAMLLAGCAGKAFTHKGLWFGKEDRILLQKTESQKGNWQTRDVDIEYSFQRDAQDLQISGEVKLGDYLINGFTTLDKFRLNLYALDAGGFVLDSGSIAFFGHGLYLGGPGKMTFTRRLPMPADTAAITFGYTGRVSDGSKNSEGRIDWSFWKQPGTPPPE
ncbi:hypothetical protein [Desulfospira joergensenii]|uniref:hypothetical protein n=1 Tax=Desulfospira joergensenii TaxID=53329 RepID=UPI0003B3F441|nr:hypothetical protein [Desulfospira joergensenii]